MEVFAILLSAPISFVATVLYRRAIIWAAARSQLVREVLPPVSIAVLALIALESTLVLSLGAVRCKELLGRAFEDVHLALFMLGVPALANVLILRAAAAFRHWFIVASLCAVFALFVVMLQYEVTEQIYGIDCVNC